jgi:hypothetical protein
MAYSWEEFSNVACFVDYNENCKEPQINVEMCIVLKDGLYFFRDEYERNEKEENINPIASLETVIPLTKEMLLFNAH